MHLAGPKIRGQFWRLLVRCCAIAALEIFLYICTSTLIEFACRSPDSVEINVLDFMDGPFDRDDFVMEDLVGKVNTQLMLLKYVNGAVNDYKVLHGVSFSEANFKVWKELEADGQIAFFHDQSGGLKQLCPKSSYTGSINRQ